MTMTSQPAIAMPQPEPESENCWRPDARPLTEMKVLIVDDDPANVELLQTILADAGFRCTKAVTDSRCTMDVSKEFQPDLVLLDLIMPHVDGFTVIAGQTTLSVKFCVASGTTPLVAVNTSGNDPVCVAGPARTRVAEVKVTPVGSAPVCDTVGAGTVGRGATLLTVA